MRKFVHFEFFSFKISLSRTISIFGKKNCLKIPSIKVGSIFYFWKSLFYFPVISFISQSFFIFLFSYFYLTFFSSILIFTLGNKYFFSRTLSHFHQRIFFLSFLLYLLLLPLWNTFSFWFLLIYIVPTFFAILSDLLL